VILVSIDPGVKVAGAAVFMDGKLTRACFVRAETRGHAYQIATDLRAATGEADVVAVETPQQYPGSPVPRHAVQSLEGVVGAVSAVYAPPGSGVRVVRYLPRAWKGQAPKEIMFRRILLRLTDEEAKRVPDLILSLDKKGSVYHHAIDAVGIGLHHLGRLKA